VTSTGAFDDWAKSIVSLTELSFSWQGGLWILLTVIAYLLALNIGRRTKGNPLANPVLVTAVLVGVMLMVSGTSARGYQQFAGIVHWMLGPATVALAIPMYAQWEKIRELGWRLVASVFIAGVIAPLTAWFTVWYFDAPTALQMTMLAKSITTPLAMEATAHIGGIPALAAVFVIATGIVGAVIAPVMYKLLNVTLPQAQGMALGAVCHAVGTAKALQMSERTGALATLGLCLNGIMTAIILPLLFSSIS